MNGQDAEASEFRTFIEAIRKLGVKHTLNWAPTKEIWQRKLEDDGFNSTAHGCVAVVIGPCEYLFATGQAQWKGDTGFGPSGIFLMSRDKTLKTYASRQFFEENGKWGEETGYAALKRSYPDERWPD